jgi:HlyD family secretion protein
MSTTRKSLRTVAFIVGSLFAGVSVAILVQATPANSLPSPTHQAEGSSMIFAAGRVEGATQEIELRAPLAGRTTNILVSEGQQVARGELLVQVEDAHYRREVDRVRAQLELAEAELNKVSQGPTAQQLLEVRALHQARVASRERELATWKRMEELRALGTTTPQEADDQRARLDAATSEAAAAEARLADLESQPRPEELRIAHARVACARAALELAVATQERTQVRAPIDGRVLEINTRLGEMAGPEAPTAMLIMADTSSFRVRAFVDEIDAPKVKVGMPAVIRADGLGSTALEGTVSRLSQRMQSKQLYQSRPTERLDTKTREVWIDVNTDTPELIVGLRVDVYLSPSRVR